MESGDEELAQFPGDCQWGRYNVNYVEADSERTKRQSQRPGGRVQHGTRIKRHASDAGTRHGPKSGSGSTRSRPRVGRRQSEVPAEAIASARRRASSDAGTSPVHNMVPCLRLSIIRHESDLRKKRVAFSDAPAVVWNDPPVIVLSPASAAARVQQAHHHHHHHHSHHSDGSDEASKESEVLTPKERRRRKVVMAVVCTTFILLTASALFVLITLFNASAIDEAGTLSRSIDSSPLLHFVRL